MRRAQLAIAVLVFALLACSTGALAIRPGYNEPTKRLEGAFKVVGVERARSPEGCYPSPSRMVAVIRSETAIKADLAAGFGSVDRPGVVFVIRRGSGCDRVRMAIRAVPGLYVLDSSRGPVYLKGRADQRNREMLAAGQGPLRALSLSTQSFRLSEADDTERFQVRCPGRTFPLGGGMTSDPPPGPDGEGVYPHSYERLGVQRGFHISPVLIDPTPGATTPRRVTLQVVCGLGLVPSVSPHKTVFVRSGETRSATARCPGGSHLFSGGFQRTNFRSPGGNYVTESRAIGKRAWRVSGHAFGTGGGELTAMAYCVRGGRPGLSEVSASTPLPSGSSATATTPPCPRGRRLTAGGFSFNGSQQALFAGGSINRDRTWSATGYGFFGPVDSLTAYGYCLRS